MNIYLPVNNRIEDFLNLLDELKPGLVTTRQVIEVQTSDKAIASLLEKIGEDAVDDLNANPVMAKRRVKKVKVLAGGNGSVNELAGEPTWP